MDRPRPRGSHTVPTATSGGLGVMAAAGLGLLGVLGQLYGSRDETLRTVMAVGFAGGLGFMGAVDDIFDLGAKAKLAIQLALSVAFAALVARVDVLPLDFIHLPIEEPAAILGSALWLVVVANAVNFMDGSDGLAAGSVAITLAALGLSGLTHHAEIIGGAALTAAAAFAGFLPWNLPMGRLFQGDAGSLFGGFLAGALALVGAGTGGEGAISLWLVPTALTPFLTDVLLTLIVRARRRARLLDAHREHLYQLWLSETSKGHAALAVRVWALTALYAAAGALAPRDSGAMIFIFGAMLAIGGWVELRRRLKAA